MAAVNQIYVIREVMKGCKNLKDPLKACFENVNICSFKEIIAKSEKWYFVLFIQARDGEKYSIYMYFSQTKENEKVRDYE